MNINDISDCDQDMGSVSSCFFFFFTYLPEDSLSERIDKFVEF